MGGWGKGGGGGVGQQLNTPLERDTSRVRRLKLTERGGAGGGAGRQVITWRT